MIRLMLLWMLADTTRGPELFNKRCTACHALDHVKAAPPLRGVYSRRAASAPGFPYSEALLKSRLVWDAETLDRWLTNPESLVPATDMSFRLNDSAERAAIIDYLKHLATKMIR